MNDNWIYFLVVIFNIGGFVDKYTTVYIVHATEYENGKPPKHDGIYYSFNKERLEEHIRLEEAEGSPDTWCVRYGGIITRYTDADGRYALSMEVKDDDCGIVTENMNVRFYAHNQGEPARV